MKEQVSARLLQINALFYQNFGPAFAATRRRIQPGIRRLLSEWIPRQGNWLDLGCGSGALAVEWAGQERTGAYIGLDFSSSLLEEARQSVAGLIHPGLSLEFYPANLMETHWPAEVKERTLDGILSFAALHHLPDASQRLSILKNIRAHLPAGGWFMHSEWQFQHSPRLMARVQPWEKAGLQEADVEAGDTLLDWRYALPGQADQVGLRYVHLFNRTELAELAEASGFSVVEEFESDGEGGRLGLYQVWRAA